MDTSPNGEPGGAASDGRSTALGGHTAVVTGATGAVGRAIAAALVDAGVHVHAIGRDGERLDRLVSELGAGRATGHRADLADDRQLAEVADWLTAGLDRIDILVHAAGIHRNQPVLEAGMDDVDAIIRTNFRAPFDLTRRLLPGLIEARGEVVLLNSSVGLRSGPGIAAYGASKHALRAFADSLRDEVNRSGVRVLSLYLGRTASAMQAEIHAGEGKTYEPERLIQPADVAAVVLAALTLPRTAEVTDISIRPMEPPRPAP